MKPSENITTLGCSVTQSDFDFRTWVKSVQPATLPIDQFFESLDDPSIEDTNKYTLSRDRNSSHRIVAGLLTAFNRYPIIDVGSGQGLLGTILSKSGLIIDAIEPDQTCGIKNNPHYRIHFTLSAEDVVLPAATYSVVVCADVLEHTSNPTVLLRRLLQSVTSDAICLVSLPNMDHIFLRPFMWIGYHPKMNRGPFDRTHLHFYNQDRAEKMLQSSGLEVVSALPTTIPLDKMWPKRFPRFGLIWLMELQRLLIRILPTFFAYQWVFIAVPNNTCHTVTDKM